MNETNDSFRRGSGRRPLLTLLGCMALIPCLSAQTHSAGKELQLNADAVKMIRFDFTPKQESPYRQLKEAPLEKKFMQFHSDLRMPRSLIDTTRVDKPTLYVRAEPYTIWTRFGEDPVYDVLPYREKKWEIHWTLQPFGSQKGSKRLTPSAAPASGAASSQAGAGVLVEFDADKLLFETFTRRGRAIRRNRKRATAWKTYAQTPPALAATPPRLPADSLNETARVHRPAERTDSLSVTPDRQRKPETPAADYAEFIRRQKAQDSLRQREFLRRDKANGNAYDIEQQIRALKRRN
ncbi:MAG: DUF4858 domain-containing protein [Phocaeicola plebeius]|nr:DUF4858 domain-containing protein [Phocaeicola plebeius]